MLDNVVCMGLPGLIECIWFILQCLIYFTCLLLPAVRSSHLVKIHWDDSTSNAEDNTHPDLEPKMAMEHLQFLAWLLAPVTIGTCEHMALGFSRVRHMLTSNNWSALVMLCMSKPRRRGAVQADLFHLAYTGVDATPCLLSVFLGLALHLVILISVLL